MSHERIPLQPTSEEIWAQKYQLKDQKQQPVDLTVNDSYERTAKELASLEKDPTYWYPKFLWALQSGATPAGRILSNAGASAYKPAVSLINCTVSEIVKDSMDGILSSNHKAGLTLKAGCGIGYEWSTLRPRNAFVSGAGAFTSGPLSFMDIFDATCFTVSSAGGRRGAQMGTMAVWHPDVVDFITAKRTNGKLRQFNLSLLIDDAFMQAVINKQPWDLVFPVTEKELSVLGIKVTDPSLIYKDLFWEESYCNEMGYILNNNCILCRIYKTLPAEELWDLIMKSTYDFAEPGFLLIDKINHFNNNYFCEEIRATNPCGEQPLPPNGSCLLGSINLAFLVNDPFTDHASFDWDTYIELIHVFSRMLDNVVELNGLPLEEQRHEITYKRRHGMGFLGLGSALSLLGISYGSKESIEFTDKVSKLMAIESYRTGIDLAIEKGPAPIFNDSFTYRGTTKSAREWWVNGAYMQRIFTAAPELLPLALEHGCRYTHATSIAPTGTISLTVNNNVSNGIEPTFSHKYTRNVIKEGQKAKVAVDVYSYEMLLYKHLTGNDEVPSFFSTTDNITPEAHVDIQAAAQYWCDSSISKTINVPTDTPFDSFKNIYLYAYEKGLKGCTTFRFNPETLQGVLVKAEDLEATTYIFELEDGTTVEAKGSDQITYEGNTFQANNLYDAIKEGYYGKF